MRKAIHCLSVLGSRLWGSCCPPWSERTASVSGCSPAPSTSASVSATPRRSSWRCRSLWWWPRPAPRAAPSGGLHRSEGPVRLFRVPEDPLRLPRAALVPRPAAHRPVDGHRHLPGAPSRPCRPRRALQGPPAALEAPRAAIVGARTGTRAARRARSRARAQARQRPGLARRPARTRRSRRQGARWCLGRRIVCLRLFSPGQ